MASGMDEKLQLLAKCPINEALKVLHSIVDKICGIKPATNYSDFQKIWTLQEWWKINDTFCTVLQEAVKNTWTNSDLTKAVGCLPADYQQAIQDCLTSRREEIFQILVKKTSGVSQNHLADFDWQLKLAVGSDKMANINKPIASVMLKTGNEENVVLEMNKDDLAKFIAALENASKAISQIQT